MGKYSILVIDDSSVVRAILTDMLGRDRYVVTIASSGEEGLELAASLHPDLILLDMMLPGMDGFEVLKRLRQPPLLFVAPVVMITASRQEEHLARAERRRH